MGLETTLKRPIINTRDEPHAVADRYRRLHVILGDANHCDVANLLKMGTTSLVLAMIEADALRDDLSVRRPVATLHEVSHDTTLQAKVELADGRRMTALELLWEYHDRAAAFVEQQSGGQPDADTAEVLHWWGTVLDRLGRDPMEARREVDWVAKLAVLEGYRERDGLGWGDPRLKAVDLQWSDVRADRGLAHRLVATGRVEVLVDEADVQRAVEEPPLDTRAWFRGTCLRRFPDDVVAASWDSVIFDVKGQRTLQRVPMLEPLKGTEAGVGDLVRAAPDAASLLEALARNGDPGGVEDTRCRCATVVACSACWGSSAACRSPPTSAPARRWRSRSSAASWRPASPAPPGARDDEIARRPVHLAAPAPRLHGVHARGRARSGATTSPSCAWRS